MASYLSDADCLLSTSLHGQAWSPIVAGKHDPENVTQLVSASVAVRGVLFGNSHPSPSRSFFPFSFFAFCLCKMQPMTSKFGFFIPYFFNKAGGMPFAAQSFGRLRSYGGIIRCLCFFLLSVTIHMA